jgi:hypothetical protein
MADRLSDSAPRWGATLAHQCPPHLKSVMVPLLVKASVAVAVEVLLPDMITDQLSILAERVRDPRFQS